MPASPSQTLTVRFTLNSAQGNGDVTLIGATLSGQSAAQTVPPPQITSINPNKASPNAQVTISGSNFGSTQGTGSVLFGQTPARVVNWSDTNVTVRVPDLSDGSTVQVAVLTDHGISNTVNFSTPSYKIYPASLNLLVGQSASAVAKDSSGNAVTGLSWSAADPTIVSLSPDDPPRITALAAGSTTVYAGDVPLPVTVYAGTSLPSGTVLWSVPVTGDPAKTSLAAAFPSDTGADVFALDDFGNLIALSADGNLIWRVTGIPGGTQAKLIPDFSGNLLVTWPNSYLNFNPDFRTVDSVPQARHILHSTHTVSKVDPITGNLTDLYTYAGQYQGEGQIVVNGTTYDDGAQYGDSLATQAIPSPAGVVFIQDIPTVSVIDLATGKSLASISLERSYVESDGCGHVISMERDPISGQMIVAGDGIAYVPYIYTIEKDEFCFAKQHLETNLILLRVSPDGSFTKIPINTLVRDADSIVGEQSSSGTLLFEASTDYPFPADAVSLAVITNADEGVVVISPAPQPGCVGCADPSRQTVMTLVTDGSVGPAATLAIQKFHPVLQREDGSYIGTDSTVTHIDAVGLDGTLLWQQDAKNQSGGLIPASPLYAIAGGGVIVTSTTTAADGSRQLGTLVTLDKAGNIISQTPDLGLTYSWKGAYKIGSIDSVEPPFDLANLATSFAAASGNNLTGNGFSLRHHTFGLIFCNTGDEGDGHCPVQNAERQPPVTPMRFVYTPGVQLDGTNVKQACDFIVSDPCNNNTTHPDWAKRIKNAAVTAYKAAFINLPAIVSNGIQAQNLNGGIPEPNLFGHTIYVDGEWFVSKPGIRDPGGPAPGLTQDGSFSWVFYPNVVGNAERFLGRYMKLPAFTPPFSDTTNMVKLMDAIGRGIGNTAAHETGHQFMLTVGMLMPDMECGPGGPKPCYDDINSVYEAATQGEWEYLDNFSPPIHWDPDDVTNLQKYFKCTGTGQDKCPK